jgi:ABC-type branched-subunit amino acid transport system substrate-binding protein
MRRVTAALACALLLPIAACGGDGGGGQPTLRIYLSVPLHGPRAADGRAVAQGARLALDASDGRAGAARVRLVVLDDSGHAGAGADQSVRGWSPVATAANARRATEDTSSIAYIGDLASGATRTSLPITNQAELLQISPASTGVDLTVLSPSGGADPDRYRPSEEQTFARLVPHDERLREAARAWARRLRAPVGVLLDGAPAAGGSADSGNRGAPHVVSPFQDSARLAPASRGFARKYTRRFGQAPAPAAAYGYEAAALVLDAIRRGDTGDERRESIRERVLTTRERRSVIGTYSIDANGDTTLAVVGGYRLSSERLVPLTNLPAPR